MAIGANRGRLMADTKRHQTSASSFGYESDTHSHLLLPFSTCHMCANSLNTGQGASLKVTAESGIRVHYPPEY